MALNKKNKFGKAQLKTSEYAKVISHPARIEILYEIAKQKKCICGEIVKVIPLAQSTVSQHLKELKKIGLIKGTTINTIQSCYCINWEVFRDFEMYMNTFMKDLKKYKTKKLSC